MQPGGPLSNLPASITPQQLESASPEDVAHLSESSFQTQEVEVLFGIPQTAQSALPFVGIPTASTASTPAGVSSADLTNATPQQQAAIDNQTLQQQQIQDLFGAPATSTGSYNLIG